MPLTSKGKKIEGAMEKEYGAKKGEQVFYASKNKGTIKGVEGKKKHIAKKMKSVRFKHQGKEYDIPVHHAGGKFGKHIDEMKSKGLRYM